MRKRASGTLLTIATPVTKQTSTAAMSRSACARLSGLSAERAARSSAGRSIGEAMCLLPKVTVRRLRHRSGVILADVARGTFERAGFVGLLAPPGASLDRRANCALCRSRVIALHAARPSAGAGYRSGRSRCRGTPVARSTISTRSAGTCFHWAMACGVISSLRARERPVFPFTARFASQSAAALSSAIVPISLIPD